MLELPPLYGDGVEDLYDSERKAIATIRDAMLKKHAYRGVSSTKEEEDMRRRFSNEMVGRCMDIGFIVEVEWEWESEEKDEDGIPLQQSPCVSSRPEDNNLYWLPRVVFIGRTEKIGDFDHDRQKSEVRSGLLDGKVGVIDPNTGKLSDSPKKKNIY